MAHVPMEKRAAYFRLVVSIKGKEKKSKKQKKLQNLLRKWDVQSFIFLSPFMNCKNYVWPVIKHSKYRPPPPPDQECMRVFDQNTLALSWALSPFQPTPQSYWTCETTCPSIQTPPD